MSRLQILNGIEVLTPTQEKEYGCNDNSLSGSGQTPYDMIRERIEFAIDKYDKKWVMPWAKARQLKPMNYKTKNYYSGINSFLLGLVMLGKKIESPYFLTYKQALELGGNVKQGAKGIPIVYYTNKAKAKVKVKTDKKTNKPVTEETLPEDIEEKEIQQSYRLLRFYSVFSANDIEGIDWKKLNDVLPKTRSNAQKIESAESIVNNMPNKPKVVFTDKEQAYYSPLRDIVNMPDQEQFTTDQEYYSTLFHELAHSTAHPTRLDRDMSGRFGSKSYAFEELIAEITAAFLCGEAGILNFTFENSKAYIKGWQNNLKKQMKADKNFIISAASKSEQAANYILDIKKEETTSTTPKVDIQVNKEKNGIEVKFDEKPEKAVTALLNEIGFKWSPRNQLWYTKYSSESLRKVKEVLSESLSAPEQVNYTGECAYIYKFMCMNGETVSVTKVHSLVKALQNDIKKGVITKTSPWKKVLNEIQHKLVYLHNECIDNKYTRVKVVINPKSLKEYGESLKMYNNSTLQGVGVAPSAPSTLSGAKPLCPSPAPKKINTTAPKAPEIAPKIAPKSESEKDKESILAQFGLTRADKKAEVKEDGRFTIPGEIGKIIQKVKNYRYCIALDGPSGGGKSEVTYQLADSFADTGREIAIFSLEMGGLESDDTLAARNRNVKPSNFKKLYITGTAAKGIDTIKEAAGSGLFQVIVIDSYQKLNIPSTRMDELRQEFPHIIWIVIFQQNGEGGTRGGVSSNFDADVVLKIHKEDLTFVNNWVQLYKNRNNKLDRYYMIAEKKAYKGYGPSELEDDSKKEAI